MKGQEEVQREQEEVGRGGEGEEREDGRKLEGKRERAGR